MFPCIIVNRQWQNVISPCYKAYRVHQMKILEVVNTQIFTAGHKLRWKCHTSASAHLSTFKCNGRWAISPLWNNFGFDPSGGKMFTHKKRGKKDASDKWVWQTQTPCNCSPEHYCLLCSESFKYGFIEIIGGGPQAGRRNRMKLFLLSGSE